MSFLQKYKKQIVTAIIVAIVGGTVPASIWFHNAWGDDRYVLKAEEIRSDIRQIDHALFEIDQEISFSDDLRDKRKWEARRKYYAREKETLRVTLREITKIE